MKDNQERYRVGEYSVSGHCCFEASVIDTSFRHPLGLDHEKAIAECFEIDSATAIAKAMNDVIEYRWIPVQEGWPETPEGGGWFQVVIEGHGKRYQKVDFWNGDDMQWKSTYEDDATYVTHYQRLREMPE